MTLEELEKNIGIKFENEKLLKQAFVHRSFLNEMRSIKESNERLEFLGDAVLSFITSHHLYSSYPQYPEGTLTNIRSSIVKTKSLTLAARELHLGELLYLSRGEEESGGRENESLLADCFEAVLGAIFLDGGIEQAKKFLSQQLFPRIEQIIKDKAYIDFKSYLQEIIQEDIKITPAYRVMKSEGPDHARTFWVAAMAGDKELSQGEGKSKQEAEQNAARSALEKLGRI